MHYSAHNALQCTYCTTVYILHYSVQFLVQSAERIAMNKLRLSAPISLQCKYTLHSVLLCTNFVRVYVRIYVLHVMYGYNVV